MVLQSFPVPNTYTQVSMQGCSCSRALYGRALLLEWQIDVA